MSFLNFNTFVFKHAVVKMQNNKELASFTATFFWPDYSKIMLSQLLPCKLRSSLIGYLHQYHHILLACW